MPKFFFHIDEEAPDNIGVELADDGAARSEAIRAAGEILRDIDGAFSGEEWRMRVRDADGNCLLELRFSVKERHRDEPAR